MENINWLEKTKAHEVTYATIAKDFINRLAKVFTRFVMKPILHSQHDKIHNSNRRWLFKYFVITMQLVSIPIFALDSMTLVVWLPFRFDYLLIMRLG
jgi:hypothetical protein